jgi:alpha-galactosidase
MTPPMGWNSWDVYGASVTEEEVLANAVYLAENLSVHGWQYVVVDIQWYEPLADSSVYRPFAQLTMDEFSRLTPAPNRFPSAEGGVGFGRLADHIHELGLKFGIHAMRGVPRQAVRQNTAILGTSIRAVEIALPGSTCDWNTDMYGVNSRAPGSREYYDSVFALYASWGVDFVKVDDVLSPYAVGEIELIRAAIDGCGRDIVLSLSCGPIDVSHAQHVRAHAQMWRMSGDFWDSWPDLLAMFDLCRAWSPYVGAGGWPDADMLPVGQLANRSRERGLGQRWTRLSHDEQVTMMTLWCIFRSPLMLGCDLRASDPWTVGLLTNDEVLDVLRHSYDAHELLRSGDFVVWLAARAIGGSYVAVFNTGLRAATFILPLHVAGLPGAVEVRDLWSHEDLGSVCRGLTVDVPSHGARLIMVSRWS